MNLMCIGLIYVTEEITELNFHLGFEGCLGGAEEIKIAHSMVLDSVPSCGEFGSVRHSDYFSAKGINNLDFAFRSELLLGPVQTWH